jgi:hypothetical protein
MSKSFSSFRTQVLEESGLVDSSSVYGEDVKITSELEIFVND